jgi:hypothetical protein
LLKSFNKLRYVSASMREEISRSLDRYPFGFDLPAQVFDHMPRDHHAVAAQLAQQIAAARAVAEPIERRKPVPEEAVRPLSA